MGRKEESIVSQKTNNISYKDAAKQTDAFKLMMDSRHKSKVINTPSKEIAESKIIETLVLNENGNLPSNEYDVEKGNFKKTEIELVKKETNKKKLIRRKEIISKEYRKKNVLVKSKKYKITQSKFNNSTSIVNEKILKHIDVEKAANLNIETQFRDENDKSEEVLENGALENKKENLVGYFKKIDKNSEHNGNHNYVDKNEIKIPNLNKPSTSDATLCIPPVIEKRKRKFKRDNPDIDFVDTKKSDSIQTERIAEIRPKRNVKKPLKYVEDMCSSNEDECLFTAKKRKKADQKINQSHTKIQNQKALVRKINKEVKPQDKNPTKLAPLFKPKLQLTPSEISAKQQFLHSGFPEQLKKNTIPLLIKHETEIQEIIPVVHVQQENEMTFNKSIENLVYGFDNTETEFEENLIDKTDLLKILSCTVNTKLKVDFFKNIKSPRELLRDIKATCPEFPVFRIYNSLKSRRRESGNLLNKSICNETGNNLALLNSKISSNCLTWIDKYKATSTSNFIGNTEVVKDMKKWLKNWIENEISRGKCPIYSSDSVSDFYDPDTTYTDEKELLNNLIILSGPTGTGKTSTIYAVASELAIKVIEVNVSSKRTGKSMLQDLREATQSHKINRRTDIFEKSKKQQGFEPTKKYKLKKKKRFLKKYLAMSNDGDIKEDLENETSQACMSLILIDDADIVFEEDDGFLSAITQLVYSSKRPVVFTTSSTDCRHLQRFLHHSKVLHMRPFLLNKLGTWLDILCVVDTGLCWPGLGSKLLDNFKGDIRKTINFLQFYMTAQKQIQINEKVSRFDFSEEQQCSTDFSVVISHWVKSNQSYLDPVDLFRLWWNVPKHLLQIFNTDRVSKSNHSEEIKSISNLLDIISVSDLLSCNVQQESKACLISEPWKQFEADFVSELQNQDMFYSSTERNDIIVQDLVTQSIIDCQRSLSVKENIDTDFPEMIVKQQKENIVSCHLSIESLVNPSNALDRRALALDYWPACRTLCRIEDSKAKTVSKRHNRYCHYFKSLRASCRNDNLNRLGESLSCNRILED